MPERSLQHVEKTVSRAAFGLADHPRSTSKQTNSVLR